MMRKLLWIYELCKWVSDDGVITPFYRLKNFTEEIK